MKNVAVITGGSSGIGLEISKLLLNHRFFVIILSRKAKDSPLRKNKDCFCINTDIGSVRDVQKAKSIIKRKLNIEKIDVLINCAGVGHEDKVENISEKDYEDFFSTNVKGTIFTTKEFLPLIKRETGIICNISSIAGIKGFSKWSLYCASKFAVEGFTKSIREELRESKIRVMVVRSGAVDTPFYNRLSEEEKRDFMKPQTIAQVVVNALFLPVESCVEEIFINNTVGDL